jgi:hypothetical protein
MLVCNLMRVEVGECAIASKLKNNSPDTFFVRKFHKFIFFHITIYVKMLVQDAEKESVLLVVDYVTSAFPISTFITLK